MSASSPAGSENSPRAPVRVGMGEKIVRFVFRVGVYLTFAIFGLVILGAIIAPAIQGGGAAPRLECLNNMRQVGLALHNYHAVNGCFPPAYVADRQGKPLYGWRVLLLPYVEQNAVYEHFHLDEPWDSPHNRKLIASMPRVYRCPSDPRKDQYFTNVAGITGGGAIFDGTKSCRLADITDGADKTLLLAETAESDIVWTEPRDLPMETLPLTVDRDPRGISSWPGPQPSIWNFWAKPTPATQHGANVIFADGHGLSLRSTVPPEILRAMITINGGERLTDDDF